MTPEWPKRPGEELFSVKDIDKACLRAKQQPLDPNHCPLCKWASEMEDRPIVGVIEISPYSPQWVTLRQALQCYVESLPNKPDEQSTEWISLSEALRRYAESLPIKMERPGEPSEELSILVECIRESAQETLEALHRKGWKLVRA